MQVDMRVGSTVDASDLKGDKFGLRSEGISINDTSSVYTLDPNGNVAKLTGPNVFWQPIKNVCKATGLREAAFTDRRNVSDPSLVVDEGSVTIFT